MLSFHSASLSLARAGVPSMTVSTPLMGKAALEKMVGQTAPFGIFDPLGLADDKSEEELMLFREAELAHGRVAMMGALGFLVQEAFHPIFPDVQNPAIRHLDQVLQNEIGQLFSSCLLIAIAGSELTRARIGWEEPEVEIRTLRPEYVPGHLGFDPLGLKPKDEAAFVEMQNKELNNGRLAMLAVAGFVAQELATEQPLF